MKVLCSEEAERILYGQTIIRNVDRLALDHPVGDRAMKRIIDGKKYDTETAEQVGEYEYRRRGDFSWYCEALYRTQKGAWFLTGEGGACSKYGEQVDQSTWGPGEGLQVLSESEARDWLERYGDADTFEAWFPVEDA